MHRYIAYDGINIERLHQNRKGELFLSILHLNPLSRIMEYYSMDNRGSELHAKIFQKREEMLES